MPRIGREELRMLFRSSELLGQIPDHEIDQLAASARRSDCSRGQVIFMRGDPGSDVMFVVKGRVKIVSTAPNGTEVIHNIIEAGQVFGEMALLDGKPRSADAIAAVKSQIVELSRQNFLEVLHRNPETTVQMMAILCGRIRQSTAFVEDALLLDSGTRLFRRLKSLAAQYGQEEPDGQSIRINHKLSQQEIGESVGLTRVSVNRIFGQWRNDGLIQDGRGYVIIPDLTRLEQALEEPG